MYLIARRCFMFKLFLEYNFFFERNFLADISFKEPRFISKSSTALTLLLHGPVFHAYDVLQA